MFKRLKMTVTSSFDSMLNQVENHEAIIACSIRETEQAARKARIKLNRVRQDTVNMRNRLRELVNLETTWKSRALKAHEENKEKALECLKRKSQISKEINTLENETQKQIQLEQQLEADIQKIEDHARELRRRKNEFAARELRTKALKTTNCSEVVKENVDDLFDRWNLKISEDEPLACSTQPIDALEAAFVEDEERADLENELKQLLKEQGQ